MIPLHSVHIHVYTSVHVHEYMYMYDLLSFQCSWNFTHTTLLIYFIHHIGSLFDALICFLLFNSADFVGRYLSNWFKMVRTNVYMYRRLYLFLSFINRDTCPEKNLGFKLRSFWLLVRHSIHLAIRRSLVQIPVGPDFFLNIYNLGQSDTFSLYCLVILIFTCTCSLDNCCISFHVIMTYDYVSSIVISNKYKQDTNWIVCIVSYHNRHGDES